MVTTKYLSVPLPESGARSCHRRNSNENGIYALTAMPKKNPVSGKTGPMGMQPADHGLATTQMLPMMPAAKGKTKQETKWPAPEKKQKTRTEAVRAVMARITRRNSLRKQRDAQKG
jgi:hypothetical protein